MTPSSTTSGNDPRVDQWKARFGDITDDEVALASRDVDRAAAKIAERTGRDFSEVRAALQTTTRQMGGHYDQGKGSAGRPDENPDEVRDRSTREAAKATKATKRTEPTPES